MPPLQAVGNKATGTITTLATAITATQPGSCLVAYVAAFGDASSPTTVTLTSGTGGTGGSFGADNWASSANMNSLSATGIDGGIWTDQNAASSTNAVKITTNGTGTQTIMVIVEEWPNILLTAAVDATATPLRQSTAAASWSVGPTGTTAQASEVAVGMAASFNSGGATTAYTVTPPGAPWTEETQVQQTSTGFYQLLAAGYQAVAVTGTFTYAGTASTAGIKTTACVCTLKTQPAPIPTQQLLIGQAVRRAAYY